MNKPTMAMTMGDPAGIGPELILKVLSGSEEARACRPLVIGDVEVLRAIDVVLETDLRFRRVGSIDAARFEPGTVDVLQPQGAAVEDLTWGELRPACGEAAARCLAAAFALAAGGAVQGVVSAPLNKEAFHQAGYDYLDDLAYLADITASEDTFTLGVVRGLWTAAVVEHVAFREILDYVKRDRILAYIRHMDATLRRAGAGRRRIGVAALNPHGGEGGLFGREEIDEIAPAVQAARAAGIDACGPVPADVIYVRAFDGAYDGVVNMHHDQANIARKLQPMPTSATIYMGLPVPCGTTAHGTAFDIAGEGAANPGSLEAALRTTTRLAAGS